MIGADIVQRPAKYVTHRGGCHCGDVQFEVSAPAQLLVPEFDPATITRLDVESLDGQNWEASAVSRPSTPAAIHMSQPRADLTTAVS